ncbi:unnamed protein product [Ambrosiozyma monospora]|uniref:Unnamed protein product n=1 Tax=Ambrosiozyma monospora TaxID=43982 RepID=A0A9W7DE51_AMBMO|nr:unnamed protein product [Ambrosiozyma monospora]
MRFNASRDQQAHKNTGILKMHLCPTHQTKHICKTPRTIKTNQIKGLKRNPTEIRPTSISVSLLASNINTNIKKTSTTTKQKSNRQNMETPQDFEESFLNHQQAAAKTWKQIIDKYSKGKQGEGDVFDIVTGELITDKGHLKSIKQNPIWNCLYEQDMEAFNHKTRLRPGDPDNDIQSSVTPRLRKKKNFTSSDFLSPTRRPEDPSNTDSESEFLDNNFIVNTQLPNPIWRRDGTPARVTRSTLSAKDNLTIEPTKDDEEPRKSLTPIRRAKRNLDCPSDELRLNDMAKGNKENRDVPTVPCSMVRKLLISDGSASKSKRFRGALEKEKNNNHSGNTRLKKLLWANNQKKLLKGHTNISPVKEYWESNQQDSEYHDSSLSSPKSTSKTRPQGRTTLTITSPSKLHNQASIESIETSNDEEPSIFDFPSLPEVNPRLRHKFSSDSAHEVKSNNNVNNKTTNYQLMSPLRLSNSSISIGDTVPDTPGHFVPYPIPIIHSGISNHKHSKSSPAKNIPRSTASTSLRKQMVGSSHSHSGKYISANNIEESFGADSVSHHFGVDDISMNSDSANTTISDQGDSSVIVNSGEISVRNSSSTTDFVETDDEKESGDSEDDADLTLNYKNNGFYNNEDGLQEISPDQMDNHTKSIFNIRENEKRQKMLRAGKLSLRHSQDGLGDADEYGSAVYVGSHTSTARESMTSLSDVTKAHMAQFTLDAMREDSVEVSDINDHDTEDEDEVDDSEDVADDSEEDDHVKLADESDFSESEQSTSTATHSENEENSGENLIIDDTELMDESGNQVEEHHVGDEEEFEEDKEEETTDSDGSMDDATSNASDEESITSEQIEEEPKHDGQQTQESKANISQLDSSQLRYLVSQHESLERLTTSNIMIISKEVQLSDYQLLSWMINYRIKVLQLNQKDVMKLIGVAILLDNNGRDAKPTQELLGYVSSTLKIDIADVLFLLSGIFLKLVLSGETIETPKKLEFLKLQFAVNPQPTEDEIGLIAQQIGIPSYCVSVWFYERLHHDYSVIREHTDNIDRNSHEDIDEYEDDETDVSDDNNPGIVHDRYIDSRNLDDLPSSDSDDDNMVVF